MEKNNPFSKFSETKTKKIKVKALGGETVEIKTALTIAENEAIAEIRYKNQTVSDDGRVVVNHADFLASKIKTVSLALVEPEMSTYELGALNGAEEAIDEIFIAFSKASQPPKKKGN